MLVPTNNLAPLDLPPTVQNWPKRFSDATFKPFGNVVTWVWLCSGKAVAYFKIGRFGIDSDSGGSGVTISSDGTFTVDPPALALPLFHSI